MKFRPEVLTAVLMLVMATPLSAAEHRLIGGVGEFAIPWIGGATKTLVDGPAHGEKALRVVVAVKPVEEWEAQTWVRPVAADIAEGDEIVISFKARSVEPEKGVITATLGMGEAPYSPAISKKLELTKAWTPYEIKGPSRISVVAAAARFGFTCGSQVQTFEITELKVVSLAK